MADDSITEEWRLTEDWPDYEVSSLGRVRRATAAFSTNPKTGMPVMIFPAVRLLRPAPNQYGYLHVDLMKNGRQKTVYIATLVCNVFHGPKPTDKHETCHNDGVPSNNEASNLRWDTRKGNFADRVKHGTDARGEKSANAVLTNDQVIAMKQRFAEGATCKEISTHFGITYKHAWAILRGGKSWKYVTI